MVSTGRPSFSQVRLGGGTPLEMQSKLICLLRTTERSAGPLVRMDGGTRKSMEGRSTPYNDFSNCSGRKTESNISFPWKWICILPWTTTLKSLSWSPASLEATHWKRAVSETWARETISRRPLADTRRPSPRRTALPSLYHLCQRNVSVRVQATLHVFVSALERRSLRDGRRRCSSGLALQLQGAVDDHCDVRPLVRFVNERRNCMRGIQKKTPMRTCLSFKLRTDFLQHL